MQTDPATSSCPDSFALGAGELIALQVRTAQALGFTDPTFADRLADGTPAPGVAVIPAAAFEYGAAPQEAAPDQDRPRRASVIERAFALGVTPVTTEAFEVYARATGWRPREDLVWLSGSKPVINVRQTDARDYCDWLSAETGQRYRLPTEQEWEHACRAGAATAFPHGEHIGPADALYNASQGYDAGKPRRPRLMSRCFVRCGAQDVGRLTPNRWGLYDLMGNVWEFTASAWTRNHASLPERPVHGKVQAVVTKGGSWFDGPEDCRAAARRRRLASELDINLGFRVLRELA